MNDRELMQQALENICGAKLCEINSMSSRNEMIWLMDEAITALRDRLAQTEQELVIDCPRCGHCCPQRPWVGLTNEDFQIMYDKFAKYQEYGAFVSGWEDFFNAVQDKLKEKNT